MVVDFDIKSYFTPNASIPFGNTQGWKRPYELGYLNLSLPADTTPEVYQYVEGQRFEDGLRAPVDFIELTKTLDQGSWCHVEMVTPSDRDIFEIVPNEGTGQMMPRMKFPYRAWEINLKDSDDSSWPDPVLFRGMLTEYSIQTLTDLKKDDQQDGNWRISLDFESFDSFCLHRDIGTPLWHHRANATTDGYHWAFTTWNNITFDAIITRIVAWMNQGRPTTDFPHSYSYTPKAAAPYTTSIFDATPQGSLTGTLTFTNGNTAVSGSGTAFTTELGVGWLIRPDANSGEGANGWGQISSITDNTNLVLTANYGGTTRAGAASSWTNTPIPIAECKDRPTWDILRDILNYMGALEGLGLKYIPTCSVAGVIDVAYGGFDKTHAVDEDFRSTQGMQKDTSTDMTIRFNTISVPFTAAADAEYWIQFVLYRSDGAGGWTTVKTIPASGYEYVPYDATNTHSRKYYSFPTQEISPENTYKWDATLVTAGSHTIALTGGSAYSPASYNFLSSPAKVKYGTLKTFAMTQGKCSQVRIYHNTTNPVGCYDGSTVDTSGGAKTNYCPDQQGCYPDPSATPAETVNAKYGILGISAGFAKISSQSAWDTLCRLNSKRIYECFQNTTSSIREPVEMTVVFNDGWTTDLVGSYLEVYSPELDEAVTIRCTEQKHVLKGKRVSTTMMGFRV